VAKHWIPSLWLAAATVLGGAQAAAEDINSEAFPKVTTRGAVPGALPEGKGVMDRARAEYDPVGVPIGTFLLFPTFAGSGTFDTNTFRAASGSSSDIFWTLSPRLDLRSQWARHALQIYTQLDRYEFDKFSTESRTNWIIGAAGRYDIAQGSAFSANAYWLDTHESRISPDMSILALHPTSYRQGHADGTLLGQFGPTQISGGALFDRFDFSATQLTVGPPINNNDRDRDVLEYWTKAAYEFAPDQNVYVRASYNTQDFDVIPDRNGLNRNSHGFNIDAGVQGMLTPLIQGSAFVGYLEQKYHAPLISATGFDYGAQIDWFVAELWTAHFSASRTLQDTIIAGASTEDQRNFGASLDYELLRNVIFQGSVNYEDVKFKGIARDDKIWSAGITGRYLINQYMNAYAAFTHSDRNSNVAGQDFNDNAYTLGIKFQM
jgi:hypothetical protein